MQRIPAIVLVALALAPSAAPADPLELPFIASDAWLRSGPSTSHGRITGLARGTVVSELADRATAFKRRDGRWVRVHVLDGRAKGREGWVWGEFVSCCKAHVWLE